MKKIISIIFSFLLLLTLTGCGNKVEYPSALANRGTYIFTATGYDSEDIKTAKPNGKVTSSAIAYFVVMETADKSYTFYEPVEGLTDALFATGTGTGKLLIKEIRVFIDEASNEYYFMDSGTTQEEALELIKEGYARRSRLINE